VCVLIVNDSDAMSRVYRCVCGCVRVYVCERMLEQAVR